MSFTIVDYGVSDSVWDIWQYVEKWQEAKARVEEMSLYIYAYIDRLIDRYMILRKRQFGEKVDEHEDDYFISKSSMIADVSSEIQ